MHLQLLFVMALTIIVGQCSDEYCLNIHNLTHAELDTLSPNMPVASIPINIKCYAKCLLRDYIAADNKIDLKRIEPEANELEKTALLRCTKQFDAIGKSAPCDYGYLILQCLALVRVS